MDKFTVAEVVRAVNGTLCANSDMNSEEIQSVSIDTRKTETGALFVPIIGGRFDGHSFIAQAFEKGAILTLSQIAVDFPHIRVENTEQAFLDLAEFYRLRLPTKLIAVTGSVGKTTTKEMIHATLAKGLSVQKSAGNLNNQTGVPQTIFTIDSSHDAAVVEMGTNHFGEIARIAKAGRPDICVFTNIGDAHIEFLGSRKGVLKAKCEMLEFMRDGGSIFANGDDELLKTLKAERNDVTTYGIDPSNDIYASDIESLGLDGACFAINYSGNAIEARITAPGRHMIQNALASFGVAMEMGLSPETAVAGLLDYKPVFGRMCIEHCGALTLLNDMYNANPSSMKASIDTLCYASGRKVAILGDMLELGADSPAYHAEIGAYAARAGVDCIIASGPESSALYASAKSLHGDTHYFPAKDELIKALPLLLRRGDSILVKASRGLEFERIADAVKALSSSL